jgi:signal transduction histidine kinase
VQAHADPVASSLHTRIVAFGIGRPSRLVAVLLIKPGDCASEIALFRILQESLTNVHRHSGSSSVEIGLTVTENHVLLSVRAFGRGMPAELRQGSDLNGGHVGVGLSGMRERVTDLGESFDIESNSQGTAIIA